MGQSVRLILNISLICLLNSLFGQDPSLKIRTVLGIEESPLGDVRVIIDETKEVVTNLNGVFNLQRVGTIEKVDVLKKGYQLFRWSYDNNELLVVLRPTSTLLIDGKLISTEGRPLPYMTVFYDGASETLMTRTDESGAFVFNIPIDKNLDLSNRFRTPKEDGKVTELEEDVDRALFEVVVAVPVGIPYTVQIMSGDSTFHQRELQVDGKSHLTNGKGEFKLKNIERIESFDWKIPGYDVVEFDVDKKARKAIVQIKPSLNRQRIKARSEFSTLSKKTHTATDLLSQPSEIVDSVKILLSEKSDSLTSDYSALDEKESASQVTTAYLSRNIDSLLSFYLEQRMIIEEQNEYILNIRDSIQLLSSLSEEDKKHILEQLIRFDESVRSIDSLFEDSQNNSLQLILQLRAKLEEQEEAIKSIEEEKKEITETSQQNFRIFLSISSGFLLLLLLSIWTIHRFKLQKRLIEATKSQLLNAQNIAKIGSMVYDFRRKKFEYSENFFKTLKIKPKFEAELLRSTNETISELLIHPKDRIRVRKLWKDSFKNKKPIQVEFQGVTDDESQIYLDMNTEVGLDVNGNANTISATLQDITEKKEHEFRLLEAIETAEEASRIKDQFLSSMSHEIRTPLNAIIGLTDFLITDKPKKSHAKKLNTIHFSSQHLLSLVNDILDFNKIKAGKLKIDTCDFWIENLLEDLVGTLEFSAKEKGIRFFYELDKDVPQYVAGDKVRINQILINLIGNAIKFTDFGEVRVKVSRKEDQVRFEVIDTGIGISPDKLTRIFEGFEQESTSTSRKYGGTGLGLSISKELAKLLGGQIEVESEIGEGSRFTFIVPVQELDVPEHIEEENGRSIIPNSLIGLKVLCVEDNEINQMVIEQYFHKWGIKSDYAETGTEALALVDNTDYDLVFMDIRLPDMNGYEVTTKILKKNPESGLPIIGLTAEIDEKTEHKIRKSGMKDFLGKPFKPEDLKRIILKHTSQISGEVAMVEEQEVELGSSADNKINSKEERRAFRFVTEKVSLDGFKKRMPEKAVDFFRKSFNVRIDEFKVEYEKALYEKDIETLDHLTHKILPNLKLMDLEKMCLSIKEYQHADLDDKVQIKKMVEEVEEYRVLIKECLLEG